MALTMQPSNPRASAPTAPVLHRSRTEPHTARLSSSTNRAAVASAALLAAGQLGRRQRRGGVKASKTRIQRLEGAQAAAPSASCPTSVVNGSMPGRYEYSAVEEDLYRWWESAGFFRPEVSEEVPQASEGDRESYVVPMPPPNVTGRLHMGHAMFVSLEDVLTRFHRMRGDRTLWLPGTDHAGIATQMLVERQLAAEGSSRQEVGREEFLRRVWEWKDEKGGAIVNQLRRLGASADWSREQFTLNDHMSSAVIEAFCRLHEKGAIFRGQRMVNWSPVLQTAVSDLEVEYSDVQGHLYHFKYMVADTEEFIPVATTRPETILGDTAVCVHPEDPRYEHLIGKDVIVPIQGRRIPVIADAYVDREFGTGALKITPAHDFNDFEIGQTHKLESHSVIGLDGSMSPTLEALGSPQYIGLDRADCRKKLWADLEEAGLTLKVEDHMQRVPLSQRSGEVIEPMLSDQWFVSTEVMAQRAMDAVESGDITIQPDRFVKTWQGWLKEKQPWCISRQLWWGHRIPVYYPTNQPGSDKYFVARSQEEALAAAREEFGEDVELRQDDDVLDTWFSSGLWPFATVGWPDESSADYSKFYPATMMETGYDILFFWVARMVMMGLTLTDKAPFKEIYLHGLVRDEKGQKMSKTKGNVVDPLDAIADYGTDALRYALLTSSVPGMDVPVSKGGLENAKAFANKIWNVGRFIITEHEKNAETIATNFESGMQFSEEEIASMPWLERALLSKCHGLCESVTAALTANRFAPPTKEIKEFLQEDVASWYVEASKTRLQDHLGGDPKSPEAATAQKVLLYLLEVSLKLLHPFMPFVTEAVWQRLPRTKSSPRSLMISAWPQPATKRDKEAEGWFAKLCAVTSAVRNARAEQGIAPKERLPLTFWCSDAGFQEALQSERSALSWLARADPDQIEARPMAERPAETPEGCIRIVASEEIEVDMPVPKKEIDVEKDPRAKWSNQVSRMFCSTMKVRLHVCHDQPQHTCCSGSGLPVNCIGSMLLVQWRTSGNLVASLDEKQLSFEQTQTVGDLKKYLHKLTGIPRFRQSLTRSEDVTELLDEQLLHLPGVLLLLQKSFCSGESEKAGKTALRQAVEKNRVEDVVACLTQPQDPNVVSYNGWSALHDACNFNLEEIANLLLEADSDIDMTSQAGFTPVNVAADRGHDGMVRVLIGAAADVEKSNSTGASPLMSAVRKRHHRCVQLLVESRADANTSDSQPTMPLHVAAETGDALIAEMLLKAGALVNAARFDAAKPLQLASRKGQDQVFGSLLKFEAELDVVIEEGASWRLFVAAMSDGDNVDVISRLLEARAVIDFRRTSPLHLASEKGLAGAVTLLLAAAADADRPDWQGARPLHLAARNGHSQVLRLLLESRADAIELREKYTEDVLQLLTSADQAAG